MTKASDKKGHLSAKNGQHLLESLEARFLQNMSRHPECKWRDVKDALLKDDSKLWSLHEMSRTGGEPDVISGEKYSAVKRGHYYFFDCAPESPSGRRSVCYDRAAREARKEHKPEGSAVELASAMGIKLLTEEQYRDLQQLGRFDLKTSSWILTPPDVRALGGALFCDRRYDKVFVYHNGAQSYYAARGFRASLII